MAELIGFTRECPNGHQVHPMRTADDWIDSLNHGTTGYWCVTCDREFDLSPAEQVRLKRLVGLGANISPE